MRVPAQTLRLRVSLSVVASIFAVAFLAAQQTPQHQVAARRMDHRGTERVWGDWQDYPVRTLQDLTLPRKAIRRDRFGGRLDRSAVKTGFFYTRKIGRRWWFIDPDGQLFLNAGVASVTPGESPKTRAALSQTFGTTQVWMEKAKQQLIENGFNGTGAWSNIDLLRASPAQAQPSLTYTINLDIMAAYGAKHGGTHQVPGHKAYPEDTIFAFDPAFEKFADEYVAQKTASYHDDPNLLGYFSDNEIPLLLTNLDGFLRLPETDAGRQAADQWMKDHHANVPTDELRSAFLEFEAGRYFRIVASAIHKHDPHHIYLGCRFYGQQLRDPELFRAIGKYAGAVSINIYGVWQPEAATTTMWEHEAGKPFLVTEFYAKAEDSGMANRTGAGWLVHTQNDRGLFYQNFVLALIESRACVGWHWFKYQDNDPDDPNAEPSNVDSNKGIVNRFYQPYIPLLARMRELNLRMYELADRFDSSAELQNSASYVDSSHGDDTSPGLNPMR